MPVSVQSIDAHHDSDPKQLIWDELGDRIAKIHPVGTQLVVCVYERPKKTTSGLYLPDSQQDDDKWQGTVGLLVAMGPQAFVDDEVRSYEGARPKVGDWIVYRVGDTLRQHSKRRMLRLLNEDAVRCIVDDPDILF